MTARIYTEYILTACSVMAVPLRVLWNLRISRIEKFSIGLVFMVGLITMATAVIRSVALNSSSSTGQVSTTWLMLVSILHANLPAQQSPVS